MRGGLRRWPLLVVGLLLIGTAVGVGASGNLELNPGAQVALLSLGAAFLGAFVYSQGRSDGVDDEDPDAGK